MELKTDLMGIFLKTPAHTGDVTEAVGRREDGVDGFIRGQRKVRAMSRSIRRRSRKEEANNIQINI